jgi:hypothetical protein
MSIMFSAVALPTPIPRTSLGCSGCDEMGLSRTPKTGAAD